MKEIVFATNNPNKLQEASEMLKGIFELRSLQAIGCREELPETHETLSENAIEKATYVHEHYGCDCFAEDTGLIVPALGGAPGVYSARYSGPKATSKSNIEKLLKNLDSETDRQARFETVICLILNGKKHLFTGEVHGRILNHTMGNDGFGYDPVFQPKGHERSFAMMDREEKARISHRGMAVQKLMVFLQSV